MTACVTAQSFLPLLSLLLPPPVTSTSPPATTLPMVGVQMLALWVVGARTAGAGSCFECFVTTHAALAGVSDTTACFSCHEREGIDTSRSCSVMARSRSLTGAYGAKFSSNYPGFPGWISPFSQ